MKATFPLVGVLLVALGLVCVFGGLFLLWPRGGYPPRSEGGEGQAGPSPSVRQDAPPDPALEAPPTQREALQAEVDLVLRFTAPNPGFAGRDEDVRLEILNGLELSPRHAELTWQGGELASALVPSHSLALLYVCATGYRPILGRRIRLAGTGREVEVVLEPFGDDRDPGASLRGFLTGRVQWDGVQRALPPWVILYHRDERWQRALGVAEGTGEFVASGLELGDYLVFVHPLGLASAGVGVSLSRENPAAEVTLLLSGDRCVLRLQGSHVVNGMRQTIREGTAQVALRRALLVDQDRLEVVSLAASTEVEIKRHPLDASQPLTLELQDVVAGDELEVTSSVENWMTSWRVEPGRREIELEVTFR